VTSCMPATGTPPASALIGDIAAAMMPAADAMTSGMTLRVPAANLVYRHRASPTLPDRNGKARPRYRTGPSLRATALVAVPDSVVTISSGILP
jgi:hypothetical protein